MAVMFSGLPEGVVSWSVDEDATSLDRGDSPSGVPSLTVEGVGSAAEVLGELGQKVVVRSTDYGVSNLTVTDASVNEGGWGAEGGSPLHGLVQVGRVRSGSRLRADQAMTRFFEAVGMKAGDYTLRVEGLESRLFEVPAANGVVWGALRQWLSANELDLSYVLDTIVVRPMRQELLYVQDLPTSYRLNLESGSLATRIDVNVHHRTHFDRGVVFPGREPLYPDADEQFSDTEYSAISVNAGEVVETTLKLSAEVESIQQPRMVTEIPVVNGRPGITPASHPSGIYMVVGKDNKRIMPAQWEAMGGGLSVKLNDDHRSVTVRVSGMAYEELSPYRIAESDGKNDHPGLFLVGHDGEFVDIETVRFDTGVGNKSDEVTTITNPAITDRTLAYHAAQAAADKATGHSLALDWNGPDPVRSGVGDIVRQAFGRIPGARFLTRGHWWRARQAGFDDQGVSIVADRDTQLADIQGRYPKVSDLSPAGRTLRQLGDTGILSN